MSAVAVAVARSSPKLRIALLVLILLALLLVCSWHPITSSSLGQSSSTCSPTSSTPIDPYSLPGILTTRSLSLSLSLSLPSNLSSSLTYPHWLPLSPHPLPPTHGLLLPHLLLHLSLPPSSRPPLSPQLQQLSNQTLLLLGDSNERALVDSFCQEIVGKEAIVRKFRDAGEEGARWHADPHVCEVELGEGSWVRVVGVMLFGVLVQSEEEGEELWDVKKGKELEGPWTVENRVEMTKSFLLQLGGGGEEVAPPVIHFSSTLWDLMYSTDYPYFSSLPSSSLPTLPGHSTNPFSSPPSWGWTPLQLSTYLHRLSSTLSLLQTTFPNSHPIVLRTLHPLAHTAPPSMDFWNPLRIAQLNSAIHAASLSSPVLSPSSSDPSSPSPAKPRIKLFDLHSLLAGLPETELLRNKGRDRVHLEWETAGWVWMEGVLRGGARG